MLATFLQPTRGHAFPQHPCRNRRGRALPARHLLHDRETRLRLQQDFFLRTNRSDPGALDAQLAHCILAPSSPAFPVGGLPAVGTDQMRRSPLEHGSEPPQETPCRFFARLMLCLRSAHRNTCSRTLRLVGVVPSHHPKKVRMAKATERGDAHPGRRRCGGFAPLASLGYLKASPDSRTRNSTHGLLLHGDILSGVEPSQAANGRRLDAGLRAEPPLGAPGPAGAHRTLIGSEASGRTAKSNPPAGWPWASPRMQLVRQVRRRVQFPLRRELRMRKARTARLLWHNSNSTGDGIGCLDSFCRIQILSGTVKVTVDS